MSDELLDEFARQPPPAAPPLSADLEAELGKLAPVAPRRPMRQLATLVGISLVYGAGLLAALTMRRDMHELPTAWIVGAAAAWLVGAGIAWFVGFAVPCYLALVPSKDTMMPRTRWAAASAIVTSVGAMKVRAHRGYEALRKLLGGRPAAVRKAAGGAQ